MRLDKPAANNLSAFERLDAIRMNPVERRAARASLRQAQLLAELILRAHAQLRRAFVLVGQGISAVARGSKLSPVLPE